MGPKPVSLPRELGLDIEWLVMGTNETAFFDLTQRLQNLIHGAGDPRPDEPDQELDAAVSSEIASELKQRLGRDEDRAGTHVAWSLLRPYAEHCDRLCEVGR